ncbi:MAG: hypothetical protein OXJ52_09235 [Oligoflexia bacterium]|nr:hypothetical protein [Oligoflexia bacterium]
MSLHFYSSPVKVENKKKQWIRASLKKFQTKDLSELSEKQLKQSVKLYKQISSSHSHIVIFAFGGIGASFRIAQSFFSAQNKKVTLVDSLDLAFRQKISQLSPEELLSSHFVFISKSGQTSEILFYKELVKKLYSKNKLSLKNRLTLLTQNLNSPLLSWGKKAKADVVFLEDSLPGRFSFFSLSGWFQFQSCGLKITPNFYQSFLNFYPSLFRLSSERQNSRKTCPRESREPALVKRERSPSRESGNLQGKLPNSSLLQMDSQIFDFFAVLFEKKEIYFCPFQPELNALSRWLELSWSESLFKEEMKRPAPLLRAINWPDLRHGFIEELIAKREQVCFWALDIKTDKKDPLKDKLESLLRSKRIPCLFIDTEKKLPAFLKLIMLFYTALFLAGEFSEVDIRTQPWVDYFKK